MTNLIIQMVWHSHHLIACLLQPLTSSSHHVPVPTSSQLSMFQEPLTALPLGLPHFSTHYENVKKYHQTIQKQKHPQPGDTDQGVPAVSRSTLFKTLRYQYVVCNKLQHSVLMEFVSEYCCKFYTIST